MTILLSLAAAQALSLSCVVDPPRNVLVTGDTATAKAIGLPPEMNKWRFDVSIGEGRPAPVRLNWPGDPIRAGKATAAMQIGPNDYSFISVHSGPCLFTETGCVFLFTVSVHNDGTADILVQPSAITSQDDQRRMPFQVFMKGRCAPAGVAK